MHGTDDAKMIKIILKDLWKFIFSWEVISWYSFYIQGKTQTSSWIFLVGPGPVYENWRHYDLFGEPNTIIE